MTKRAARFKNAVELTVFAAFAFAALVWWRARAPEPVFWAGLGMFTGMAMIRLEFLVAGVRFRLPLAHALQVRLRAFRRRRPLERSGANNPHP
jgi:hypothetical protein